MMLCSATITLHNPYIDFNDQQCVSTSRCVNSARCILGAYYMLSATSLDITRLHPFVTVSPSMPQFSVEFLIQASQICWYLAAVVQVQLCKFFIESGDSDRESTVWGEINVLRYEAFYITTVYHADWHLSIDLQCWPMDSDVPLEVSPLAISLPVLRSYDEPLTARQERLLQGLMREIVRMTAQKQPLEVGVPLYPFSHSTLWRRGETTQSSPDESAGVPLPHSPPYDEQGVSPPSAPPGQSGHARSSSGWSMQSMASPGRENDNIPLIAVPTYTS